jgi:carbamate kinase
VVVALGGNALLRQGDAMSQAIQAKNIEIAAYSIAQIAASQEWNVIVTHGNGPQVGFLALKQDSFNLDVLTAETQGMIGAQLDEYLDNALPGKPVTTILTQVEVDAEDPAFKKPHKPIGPFYEKYDAALAPMVQVDKYWRKVVASPEPKRIVELRTIRALVELGNLVICCGGGGIPVVRKAGHMHGVPAVIDKDKTSALLATSLGVDAFIMLTDVDALYKNFGKPNQEKVSVIHTDHLDQEFINSLPPGSIGPKVSSAIEFAETTGGWAAIGSLDSLKAVLDGQSGTRIVRSDRAKGIKHRIVMPEKFLEWKRDHVRQWLTHDLRVNDEQAEAILNLGFDTGQKLTELHASQLETIGMSWMMATHIVSEVNFMDNLPYSKLLSVAATPYRWPYNNRLSPENTALVIIDMQRDFLEEGGYMSSMGYSLEAARRCIEPVKHVLEKMRKLGFHIIHTREGHLPNLSDCQPVKHWRSLNLSDFGVGVKGPLGRLLVKGEPGWDIINELKPLESEVIIDKPGKGAFYATELEHILRTLHIQNIVLVGVTTDVCVHTTLREANDRGFECLVLNDATAAAESGVHWSAIRSIELSGGIFGATTDSRSLLHTLSKLE